MQAITVNELIKKLQKFVIDDKQNENLPCYTFPEGGHSSLEEWEIVILNIEPDYIRETELPRRLQIG